MQIKILQNKWVKFIIDLYLKTTLLITGIVVYNTFNDIPLEFKSGAIQTLKTAINESNDVLAAFMAVIHLIWDALCFIFVLFIGQEKSKTLIWGMLLLAFILILVQKLQKKVFTLLTTTTKKTGKLLSRKSEKQIIKKILQEVRSALAIVGEEHLTLEFAKRKVRQILAHKYYKYMNNNNYPSLITSQILIDKITSDLEELVRGHKEILLHGTGHGLEIVKNVIDKR